MVIVDTIAQNTRCYHYYLVMIPHHGTTSHHAFLGLEAPVVATTRRSSGTYGAMSQSTIAQANFPQTRTVGGVLVTYSTSTQHSRMFVVPKCVHACFALVPFVITAVGSLTAIAAGEACIALALFAFISVGVLAAFAAFIALARFAFGGATAFAAFIAFIAAMVFRVRELPTAVPCQPLVPPLEPAPQQPVPADKEVSVEHDLAAQATRINPHLNLNGYES